MAKAEKKATIFTPKQAMAEMEKGIFRPFYFLVGEETFYTTLISRIIAEKILPQEEWDFNRLILYGSDVNINQVIDSAKSFPMMSERKVIVVREAQRMGNLDNLLYYLKMPQPTTVLALCLMGKSLDKRTKFYTELMSLPSVCVVESAKIDEVHIPQWVVEYAKEHGYTIEDQAASMLAYFLGSDLNKIATEMDKLFTLMGEGEKNIVADLVSDSVGVDREFNPFKLCEYLTAKNFSKVQEIGRYMAEDSRNYAFPMMLAILWSQFARLTKYHCIKFQMKGADPYTIARACGTPPNRIGDLASGARNYSLKQCLAVLKMIRSYDAMYKSNERGNAEDGDLLMEALFRILTTK